MLLLELVKNDVKYTYIHEMFMEIENHEFPKS